MATNHMLAAQTLREEAHSSLGTDGAESCRAGSLPTILGSALVVQLQGWR